jgi:hypothetical protein
MPRDHVRDVLRRRRQREEYEYVVVHLVAEGGEGRKDFAAAASSAAPLAEAQREHFVLLL